jgi:hypothetical protein
MKMQIGLSHLLEMVLVGAGGRLSENFPSLFVTF